MPRCQHKEEVKESIPDLSAEAIASADIVLVACAHTNVDYALVQRHARAVLDAKNAMKGVYPPERTSRCCRMKYALIGCGRIAANHVKAALNNDMEFVAACDIDLGKIDALFRKTDYDGGATKRYADYLQMIEENPDIELASIATESGEHARIALDCIDAGVNAIIEKPVAMSMADADEIVRRAEERGVKVSACHQNRFNVAVRHVRRAVEEGRFGRMSHGSVHVRWNRDRGYYGQGPLEGHLGPRTAAAS